MHCAFVVRQLPAAGSESFSSFADDLWIFANDDEVSGRCERPGVTRRGRRFA